MSRPFDEARYKGLLEGLEISEISLAKLENEMTIGSEYYAPEFLLPYSRLSNGSYPKAALRELCSLITDGDHGSADYVEDGILFVLSEAVSEGWVNHAYCRQISEQHASTLQRSRLRTGDVLVTKTGVYFGKSAVVQPDLEGANTIAHVGVLRPRDPINPYFLSTYLNCRYGFTQLRRRGIKATRPEIKLIEFQDIAVPIFSKTLQRSIAELVQKALTTQQQATSHIEKAGNSVLTALGLENWRPPEPLSYTRASYEATAAERFDAEYFHPAKFAAQAFLNALPGKPLSTMFRPVRELWQPENAPANEAVRNYDLNDALNPFLDDAKTPTFPAEIASTKKRIKKGDIVVSRLRSYLKEIAVVQTEGVEPLVCSTEFIVLRPKAGAIPVEALLVYLRSTLPQLIFKWSQDGSNHPRFDEKELLNLHVPDIVASISQELSDSVKAATHARQRAAELLDAAKRAVEIAIEDSEAAALAYLRLCHSGVNR